MADQFEDGSVSLLAGFTDKLNALATSLVNAAKSKEEAPAEAAYEAMVEAAGECADILEYYTEAALPERVRNSMWHTQLAVRDLAAALKAYLAIRRNTG